MSRNLTNERENLAEFVASHGGRAYTDVPVSGPELGWPSDSPVHRADAVWFETDELGVIVPWSGATNTEFASLIASLPALLVSARGYADRTAFGMLMACRELLSRAYPDHLLLRAVALMDAEAKMKGRSIVYLAEGIPVMSPAGAPRDPRGGNPTPFPHRERVPPSPEDELLARYYNETLHAIGTLWQEVPVSDAALDGMYIPAREGTLACWSRRDAPDLAHLMANFAVDVIEVKQKMNTDVIGQSIAGAIGLAHAYPRHRLITQTIVVGGQPDPCLDWVCHKRGITVSRFS